MDNLLTSTDISSLIGAFELSDHLANYGDGMLEIAAGKVALGPTSPCYATQARCIGDSALEAAGMSAALGPATAVAMATQCCPPRTSYSGWAGC
jgi:hypothetical protein